VAGFPDRPLSNYSVLRAFRLLAGDAGVSVEVDGGEGGKAEATTLPAAFCSTYSLARVISASPAAGPIRLLGNALRSGEALPAVTRNRSRCPARPMHKVSAAGNGLGQVRCGS
jgi:hypothetical protein